MKISKCNQLSFFCLLLTFPYSTQEDSKYIFSISDISKELNLDSSTIKEYLTALNSSNFIENLNINEEKIIFTFNNPFNSNISNFITPFMIEEPIKIINNFNMKYAYLFLKFDKDPIIFETAAKVKKILNENPNSDISEIIRELVKTRISQPNSEFYFSKILFNLALSVNPEDEDTLEDIMRFSQKMPYVERPMLASYCLFAVILAVEELKKQGGVK